MGALAIDLVNGDLTNEITVTGLPLDTRKISSWPVVYNIMDAVGNESSIIKIINVVDTIAPQYNFDLAVTTLWPANKKMVHAASLSGLSDNAEGDLNVSVQITSSQGGSNEGERLYTINVAISDASGNTAT